MFKFIKFIIKKTHLTQNATVPIDQCVHYCGFRYGYTDYNPYQTYLTDLHSMIPKPKSRDKFISFLKHYRPESMGEALGITLSKYVPLWVYPWNKCKKNIFLEKIGWEDDPNDCPDILTHFSDKGILQFRIEEEFVWLEKAYYSIKNYGYNPEKYNNHVELLRLVKKDNDTRYLVLDGNHRISALYTIGKNTVKAKILSTIYEKELKEWYCVRKNFISESDALKIFNVYFFGNQNYITSKIEAKLLP